MKTTVHVYPLEPANEALYDLRHGRFSGAGTLNICPHYPTLFAVSAFALSRLYFVHMQNTEQKNI